MQQNMVFSCIGYEWQTFQLKKGYAPPAYPFRSRSWLNHRPSEKVPFFSELKTVFLDLNHSHIPCG